METNRFLLAYKEFKEEKEREQQFITQQKGNNRFACLRGDYRPQTESGRRFECLLDKKSNSNYIDSQSTVTVYLSTSYNTNFNKYENTIKSKSSQPTYLASPEDKQKLDWQPSKEKYRSPCLGPPVFSFESNFHFPDLCDISKKSDQITLPPTKKEMIVNPVITPVKKDTFTVLSRKDGKLTQKEVFIDGTPVTEQSVVIVKKPVYTSWASVLKSDTISTCQYIIEKTQN
jgi:hypothetical protein